MHDAGVAESTTELIGVAEPVAAFLGALIGSVITYFGLRAIESARAKREDRYRFAEDRRDAYITYAGHAAAFLEQATSYLAWRGIVRDEMRFKDVAAALFGGGNTPEAGGAGEAVPWEASTTRNPPDRPSLQAIELTLRRLEVLAADAVHPAAQALYETLVRIHWALDDPDTLRSSTPENRRFDHLRERAIAQRNRFLAVARIEIGIDDKAAPVAPPRLPWPTEEAFPIPEAVACGVCHKPIGDVGLGEIRWFEDQVGPPYFRWKFRVAHKPGTFPGCIPWDDTPQRRVVWHELGDYFRRPEAVPRLIDHWTDRSLQPYVLQGVEEAEEVLRALVGGVPFHAARRLYAASSSE